VCSSDLKYLVCLCGGGQRNIAELAKHHRIRHVDGKRNQIL